MFSNFVKPFTSNFCAAGVVAKSRASILRNTFSTPLLLTAEKISSDRDVVTFKERTRRFLLSNLVNQPLQYLKPALSYSELTELKKQLNKTGLVDVHIPLNQAIHLFHSISPDDRISVLSLDKLAATKLSECTKSELAHLSLVALKLLGNHFTKGEFYSSLMQQIEENIDLSDSHRDLVVWTFICTLSKSNKGSSFRILRKIYERFKCQVELFKVLSSVETSILCNAWFANGILVSSKPMLRFIDATLVKETNANKGEISQDSLPMLKVLRKACFASDELLLSLAETVRSSSFSNLNLAESTHA